MGNYSHSSVSEGGRGCAFQVCLVPSGKRGRNEDAIQPYSRPDRQSPFHVWIVFAARKEQTRSQHMLPYVHHQEENHQPKEQEEQKEFEEERCHIGRYDNEKTYFENGAG